MTTNKRELAFLVRRDIAILQNKLLRVIAAFPENWHENHVMVAKNKLMMKSNMTVSQIMDEIKGSWACHGENFRVDNGDKPIPLT